MSFKTPNKFRLGSDDSIGNSGAFIIKLKHSQTVLAIASDALGWEHVSVSRRDRCPTWEEMCQIKSMFWDESDCVVQFHPPKSEYVNNHPFCLHLWRPTDQQLPMPASLLVGIKENTA